MRVGYARREGEKDSQQVQGNHAYCVLLFLVPLFLSFMLVTQPWASHMLDMLLLSAQLLSPKFTYGARSVTSTCYKNEAQESLGS